MTRLAPWPESGVQETLLQVADELGMIAGALTTVLPEWNEDD